MTEAQALQKFNEAKDLLHRAQQVYAQAEKALQAASYSSPGQHFASSTDSKADATQKPVLTDY